MSERAGKFVVQGKFHAANQAEPPGTGPFNGFAAGGDTRERWKRTVRPGGLKGVDWQHMHRRRRRRREEDKMGRGVLVDNDDDADNDRSIAAGDEQSGDDDGHFRRTHPTE